METTDYIIHLGHPIAQMIYDHDLSLTQWDQMIALVTSQPHQVKKGHYQIYQYNGLTYQVDTETNRCLCYSEIVSEVTTLKSLNYRRHRVVHNYDFLPINQYYNVHEVIRDIYILGSQPTATLGSQPNNIEFIFEHNNDDDHRQVMITGSNLSQMLIHPIVQQLSQFCTHDKPNNVLDLP
jgi:hypothetical protein